MRLALFLLLIHGLAAQSLEQLPKTFAGAYMSVRTSDAYRAGAGTFVCTRLKQTFGCLTTDNSKGTSTTQASVWLHIQQWRWLNLFGNAGAGQTATAENYGGAFSAGGALTFDLAAIKMPGVHIIVSARWVKENATAPVANNVFVDLASRTALNIGIGKTWE